MAPRGRKNKVVKGTTVSAASRKWKVGDLVLAKVRGFPAWPARVTEPEKCRYLPDWKKVLVCFFGTNEIAFLNPADVEAFTEEKKEALLAQRRGKSADFVRALQEIIEIFENPTNNSQLDDFNEIVEVIGTNLGNSDGSVPSSRLMNQSEGSSGTLNSGLNGSFNWGTFERSTCSDNVCTTAFSDRDALSEESTDNVVAATSFATTSNSKQNYELPQGSVSQTRALWSRKVSSSKNLRMQSIDGNESIINIVSKIVMDDSLIRNKITTRLPEASDVAISSACASLGETESMGSEGVTVDPEAHYYNECSNPEFGGNHELIETVKGSGIDLVVGRIADFQNEHAVIKKKRKANRKREISELPELTAAPDEVADGDAELQKNAHDLPNICEKSGGKFANEVGDEHLPLMKRARVRMENLSTSKEKLDHLIKMEDSSSKDAPHNVAVDLSINCGGDENRKSLTVKEDMVQLLPSNTGSQVTENMPKESNNGKIQVSGSLDGEAALPLSKRLHHSPNVMSAHVPEDDSVCAETSMPNGGCVSFFLNYHHRSRETKAGNMEERYEDSYGQSALKNQTSQYFVDVNLSMSEENKRPRVVSNNGTNYIKCSDSSKDDFEAEEGEIQTTRTYNFLQNLNGIPANFRFDQDSLDRLSPKDGKKCESIGRADSAEAAVKESDTSRSTRISTTSVSGADIVTNVPPENGANITLNYKTKDSAVRDSTQLMKISPDGCQIDGMCEAVTEDNSKSFKHTQRVDIWRTKHVPDASSPSYNDRLVKNYVSSIHSKPSSAYGTSFPITDLPLNASPLHMTNIGSNNFLKSNGYCSPEVQLHGHNKKSNNYPDVNEKHSGLAVTSSGRSNSVDTRDFLRSFETILGALTRKRESIGRATDIGIQCAKEGYAAKVLDTLIRVMENERSLRKRLDLFFLLDSITQGCRSLKGDVRETFFAAILSALPRVLLTAAPPGNTGRQNRRQCLQVLRLWLERRVLPKSVVQHHIRDINSLSYLPSSSAFSKRQHRNERAFDDPIREMGGLVDEYGSNSSIQIPDFCMPPTLNVEADRSDSDSGNFEAVTPEHNSVAREEPELAPMTRMRRHVLKDVDNELDMDDVAPCITTNDVKSVASSHTSNYEHHMPSFLAPPLPDHEPPTFPPPSAVDLELYVGANVNYMQAKLDSGHLEVPSTITPAISQSVNYCTPEFPNLQMQTCLRGFTSYDRNAISPLPIGPMNFPPRRGGEVLYSKAYFQPPPSQRTPSSQFSYSQVNRQMQAGRNPAFPHCNRYHFQPKLDGKAFHTGHHDRYTVPDFNERWRGSRSSFSGQFHPHDRDGVPSAPASYMEGEPTRRRNHGLVCPSREMNYRNTMPIRTSLEAPRNWR